jgi:hypothetical protein
MKHPKRTTHEPPKTGLRATRSLVNSADYWVGEAEASWLRFVTAAEALQELYGDVEVGKEARDIAQRMHELGERLARWAACGG